MRYLINEKAPYPGYWQPLALYLIQAAEFGLWAGVDKSYAQRATVIRVTGAKPIYLYGREDAAAITAWLAERFDYMQFDLIEVIE